MPILGTRDVTPLIATAPVMAGLKTEPFVIHGAEILQLMYEIDGRGMEALVPPALHPTIPPTVTFIVGRFPEGPAGPFTLAQLRVGSRAGVRPRGFLLACYCDSAAASAALQSRWGFNTRPGVVRLRHLHDRVVASVEGEGAVALHIELIDPQPISGGDVQYTANMNLARVPYGDTLKPRLVQVDPEFTFQRAERGQPQIVSFDRGAWNATGLDPVYPISATFAVSDMVLPRIRYVMDPDLPAMQGTETVA